MMEQIIGKKENWSNKGTDKPYVTDSLIHITSYNLSYLMFVPNFKILGQAVPGKSLTEKKVYTQTDNSYRKGKTIHPLYPIYFIYRGYNEGFKDSW